MTQFSGKKKFIGMHSVMDEFLFSNRTEEITMILLYEVNITELLTFSGSAVSIMPKFL
jgi:hypothetical protein